MRTRPEYGTELTRRGRASLFGPGGADDYRGVVQREGKVPLKGGEWRKPSHVLLAEALAALATSSGRRT